ncbi:MAG: hypothetical protein WA609_06540 [Terriglobales bacterium]
MKNNDDGDIGGGHRIPVIVQTSSDFQLDVLEKLGRLEAKVDMLVGNGQPGRMRLAEERLTTLEKNDIKRSVYDRFITAAIAFSVSAAIGFHDHLLPK